MSCPAYTITGHVSPHSVHTNKLHWPDTVNWHNKGCLFFRDLFETKSWLLNVCCSYKVISPQTMPEVCLVWAVITLFYISCLLVLHTIKADHWATAHFLQLLLNSEREKQRVGCDRNVLQMAVVEQAYAGKSSSAFLSRMLTPPQVTDDDIELLI